MKLPLILSSLCSLLLVMHTLTVSAQERPSTFGEIKFDDGKGEKKTYADTVRSAAMFFDTLASAQSQLKAGKTAELSRELDQDTVFYLAGLYLYCIQRSGVCRLIPDALYEAELIRAKTKGEKSCTTIKRFWQAWRDQGMEERAKYLVPMASIKSLSDYNQNERPRLIKCEETVAIELAGADAVFFKTRYMNDERRSSLGKNVAQVIRQLEEKQVNVFLSTGAMGGTAPDKAKQ